MKKIFLGGTCNNSTWRERLIPMLQINYFNPVVDNWTPECQEEEIKQRAECEYCLYVISPKMTGVYSICEVIEDSIKRPNKTLFCLLETDDTETFSPAQIKSFKMMKQMITSNNAKVFETFGEIANYVNNN